MNRVNIEKFSIGFLVMCVLIIISVSCGTGTTKIGDIISHPRDYVGKEVTISGEVTETFSMIVIKYFIVRDNSGEIPVITDRPLPAKGEKIKVKGSVKETFSIGTQTALVLMESKEKTK